MISVIQTGGKQYVVKSGDTLRVEKLLCQAGDAVVFDKVLLTANDDGSDVKIGAPTVAGTTVSASCVSQGRADKIRVVKFKRKVRYRRVHGHRQAFTSVKIV